MNKNRIKNIVLKDIHEILHNRMAIIPMLIVPLVFCLVLPLVITFLVGFAGATGTEAIGSLDASGMIANTIHEYTIPPWIKTLPEQFLFVFLNYSFMALFMLIPLMAASIIAANSIVGEKERKTLETLLYTPITNQELLWAKLLSAFIPAVGIAFFFFGLYYGTINLIFLIQKGHLMIQTWLWLPALLLLTPAVSLLGLAVTVIVSLKAKTFMEAQQFSAFIVLPLIGLIIAQLAGLFVLHTASIIILSLVIIVISYLIIHRLASRFNREKIIENL